MKINENIRKQMKEMIMKDEKLEYCHLCSENYSECINIARDIFKLVYYTMDKKMDKEYKKYLLPLLQAEKDKNEILKNEILDKAIELKITIPYVYLSKAVSLRADKRYKESINICNEWLNSELWKIPNMAKSTIDIIKVKEGCLKEI